MLKHLLVVALLLMVELLHLEATKRGLRVNLFVPAHRSHVRPRSVRYSPYLPRDYDTEFC